MKTLANGRKSVTTIPDCPAVQVNQTALLTPVVGNTQVAQESGDVKMKENLNGTQKRVRKVRKVLKGPKVRSQLLERLHRSASSSRRQQGT
jgi:hypothetical protein